MKLGLLIFFVIIFPFLSYSQSRDSLQIGSYSKIEKLIQENKIPAVGIGVIRNNELVQVIVVGKLKKDGATAPYNSIFNVASLMKPVIGMLTLTLVNNGNWDLDEPLSKYWIDPDIKDDTRHKKLTTRIVLSHQTGFKNWRYLTEGKLRFEHDPGTKFGYSGEGLEYLRKAIESKFKVSIAHLVDSLIFKPLDMQDSHMYWDSKMNESRFAQWHDKDGNNTYPIDKRNWTNAADDLLITVEDYGKFCSYVLKGFGLSKSVSQEMKTNQLPFGDRAKFGLAWEMIEISGTKDFVLAHTGGDIGVQTMVALHPSTGEGLIVFSNGDNGDRIYQYLIPSFLSMGWGIRKFF